MPCPKGFYSTTFLPIFNNAAFHQLSVNKDKQSCDWLLLYNDEWTAGHTAGSDLHVLEKNNTL